MKSLQAALLNVKGLERGIRDAYWCSGLDEDVITMIPLPCGIKRQGRVFFREDAVDPRVFKGVPTGEDKLTFGRYLGYLNVGEERGDISIRVMWHDTQLYHWFAFKAPSTAKLRALERKWQAVDPHIRIDVGPRKRT